MTTQRNFIYTIALTLGVLFTACQKESIQPILPQAEGTTTLGQNNTEPPAEVLEAYEQMLQNQGNETNETSIQNRCTILYPDAIGMINVPPYMQGDPYTLVMQGMTDLMGNEPATWFNFRIDKRNANGTYSYYKALWQYGTNTDWHKTLDSNERFRSYVYIYEPDCGAMKLLIGKSH